MLNVCITKQNTCYDLYTRTGPDLRSIVESSNMRSGPIGLWEKYNCEVRILEATDDYECNLGRRYWEKYTAGWELWPKGAVAENVEDVNWAKYDVVIAIDVAVPRRIIRRFPTVMWCYYFVEGGPLGIETIFRGSPFYGYNVFFNHRCAKSLLNCTSKASVYMRKYKRAVLDFPYYLQSPTSVRRLYGDYQLADRRGIVLGHHSYPVINSDERRLLDNFGGIRDGYRTISDIHRLELQSKYFIIHPDSRPCAGLALVEAISSGCLALAPRKKLWGFPDLIEEDLDYTDFNQLSLVMNRLEQDQNAFIRAVNKQQDKVDKWFFSYPTANLELMLDCFRQSRCSRFRQKISERMSVAKGLAGRLIYSASKRLSASSCGS